MNVVDLWIVSIIFFKSTEHIALVSDSESDARKHAEQIVEFVERENGLYYEEPVQSVAITRRSLNGIITSGFTTYKWRHYIKLHEEYLYHKSLPTD